MVVIKLHPTEELKLINCQKELVRRLFTPGALIYAHQPLWFPVDFASVQEAKECITGVTLTGVEYDEDAGVINVLVKIDPRGTLRQAQGPHTKLPLLHIEGDIPNVQAALKDTPPFPLPLKIFRLGECTSPSPGVYELRNIIWKKLS